MATGIQPRVLASTTSHKREPLLPTLEIFGRLGLHDLELNLHHIIETGVAVADVARAVAVHGLRVWVLAGGWCDFFTGAPEIDETFASIARQAAIADALGVRRVRLFFGRLRYADYSPVARRTITANLLRLSDAHPTLTFAFENHDGASLHPEVNAEVMHNVDRPNIRLNFDPINFAKAGVDPAAALATLRPFIGHVHLKGLAGGEYCEFGQGDVDVDAIARSLDDGGYRNHFAVEYEGPFDGTLRLYRSVGHARALLGDAPLPRVD
jgi:sugar phosphate isomerase/epimerase